MLGSLLSTTDGPALGIELGIELGLLEQFSSCAISVRLVPVKKLPSKIAASTSPFNTLADLGLLSDSEIVRITE